MQYELDHDIIVVWLRIYIIHVPIDDIQFWILNGEWEV
jgi:hypothetical protein